MKIASDFRKTAREGLKGQWLMAIIAGFIATWLGGATSNSVGVNFNVNASGGSSDTLAFESAGAMFSDIPPVVFVIAGIALLVGLVFGVAYFILGSFMQVGYAKLNLNAVDKVKISIDTLFSYAHEWKRTAIASFWQNLYIILWSFLFIVPGIVASYRYAMTRYIMAEDDTISPREAIERSKELMKGNKWRLFCLEFSFIGWSILAGLTFGIGDLWLTPYRHAAEAAFYRDITGTEVVEELISYE
ncbi:MAG: DUF975 family protein [Clostridia bacterium]|nr:DUF975 family protein [Clostridia bacterium]